MKRKAHKHIKSNVFMQRTIRCLKFPQIPPFSKASKPPTQRVLKPLAKHGTGCLGKDLPAEEPDLFLGPTYGMTKGPAHMMDRPFFVSKSPT